MSRLMTKLILAASKRREVTLIDQQQEPERPSLQEQAAKEAVEYIDKLCATVAAGETIEVVGPDGREWMIMPRAGYATKIMVYWKQGGYWQDLNPGWGFVPQREGDTPETREMKTRIILGQIFAGQRVSGRTLQNLICGAVINDGRYGNHIF